MDPVRITGRDTAPGLAPDIACDLGEERAATQAERWLRLGREAGLGRAETADGLEIRFRDEAAAERELRDLVSVESKCCAWARWEVRRANGELVMRVTSTPEGAAALHAMFGNAGNLVATEHRRTAEKQVNTDIKRTLDSERQRLAMESQSFLWQSAGPTRRAVSAQRLPSLTGPS
ncbi:MAG TPA: hypothetical protein VHT26_14455 [Trebonia sp.]|nr:hypothetical protein [Trebonia sp.]